MCHVSLWLRFFENSGVLLFLAIVQFKVQWLIVIFAALSLSAANIVGYTKCSKEAQQRLQNLRDGHLAPRRTHPKKERKRRNNAKKKE